MVRTIKREPGNRESEKVAKIVNLHDNTSSGQGESERRVLRSRYLAVKNLINNERDDITRQDSNKFKSIITEVEALHENVKRPREQVIDAEALLDLASTLATSVRSQNNEGLTPSDLVTALLKNFGHQDHGELDPNSQIMVSWDRIGNSISHIFNLISGCCTMIGPMSNEIKQRKPAIYKKRSRPTESTRPKEIDCKEQEMKTDTDSNMSTMFDILKKKRRVRLECLLLNRVSFAQTVENVFALSFLVKDGRAEIAVDGNGFHFVSPKNAPNASAVASGAVSYHHFVFRFDFKDWKAMMGVVGPGEELMPHRNLRLNEMSPSNPNTFSSDSRHNAAAAAPCPAPDYSSPHSTPIRKLTRNRGLVVQEDSIVEDSVEKEPPCKKHLKGKRLQIF